MTFVTVQWASFNELILLDIDKMPMPSETCKSSFKSQVCKFIDCMYSVFFCSEIQEKKMHYITMHNHPEFFFSLPHINSHQSLLL
jgi:hypothetical protein